MSEELIQKITKQVLESLGQKNGIKTVISATTDSKPTRYSSPTITSTGSCVILLCGGDKNLPEVYRQMTAISKQFVKTYVIMTPAATRIIGVPTARQAIGGGTIITDYTENYMEIITQADAIFVPVLSLNTAAKVAALNADSLATITMVFGRMNGKAVIAAKDSIYCCHLKPENIPPEMHQRINEMIAKLESMGIQIVNLQELTATLGSIATIPPPPKITGVTESSPFHNVTCASGECSECGHCIVKRPESIKAIVESGAARISVKPGVAASVQSNLASYIDHTLLKPEATDEQIKTLCTEAKTYTFASVCVNPTHVAKCAAFLKGTPVKVCTVIGFPLGATTPTVKEIETRDAIANGAGEIDMVINVGALKSGNDELVRRDIEAVVNAAKGRAIVKVILETALLTKEEIVKGCILAKLAGADFVKTSTGFSTRGATVEDIQLMRATVGPNMGVKASGGIRDREITEKMIKAGATRIGASASVAIVQGVKAGEGKY